MVTRSASHLRRVGHSGARPADVRVAVDQDVVLSVVDDGRGIGETGRRSGLANLAARAEQLGGRFDLTGGPGHGTCVIWTVPLPA